MKTWFCSHSNISYVNQFLSESSDIRINVCMVINGCLWLSTCLDSIVPFHTPISNVYNRYIVYSNVYVVIYLFIEPLVYWKTVSPKDCLFWDNKNNVPELWICLFFAFISYRYRLSKCMVCSTSIFMFCKSIQRQPL